MTTMNISKGLNSTTTMKHVVPDNLLGKDLSRIVYNQSRQAPMRLLPGPTSIPADGFLTSKSGRVESMLKTMNKLAKSKLSLGVKILQIRGAEQFFRTTFSMKEGEQLLKASKCCLSTTSGPVAGRLFISTDKLAFCSDKPIAKLACPSGQSLTFHYKVVIPLAKIKRASQSENVKKPSQKYLQVVTADEFDFWFMGCLDFKRTFKFLQQAVSQIP
uniref:GRAM domain-containing protein n=1 Tax=Opuntia streptacantha TaxID=393608 RepID=A0A7C9EQV0_OPUST